METILHALLVALNRDGMVTLGIKAKPGAQRTAIKSILEDGTIKIDIAAAPEDGKANVELVEYLSEVLGVAKHHIEILAGHTSPRKTIRVTR